MKISLFPYFLITSAAHAQRRVYRQETRTKGSAILLNQSKLIERIKTKSHFLTSINHAVPVLHRPIVSVFLDYYRRSR
jgi:hypothetical protein